MQLTDHFSLEELTATAHRSIDNTPTPAALERLKHTATCMEEVRGILGHSIHVNSGYRCPALNKAVGGSVTSAHMSGDACDFICPGFGDPLAICRDLVASGLAFNQIIQEGTWVHLSFASPLTRRSILTKKAGGGYKKGL